MQAVVNGLANQSNPMSQIQLEAQVRKVSNGYVVSYIRNDISAQQSMMYCEPRLEFVAHSLEEVNKFLDSYFNAVTIPVGAATNGAQGT